MRWCARAAHDEDDSCAPDAGGIALVDFEAQVGSSDPKAATHPWRVDQEKPDAWSSDSGHAACVYGTTPFCERGQHANTCGTPRIGRSQYAQVQEPLFFMLASALGLWELPAETACRRLLV